MNRIFQEIKIGSIGVMASGGLVDISRPVDVRGGDKLNKHERLEQKSWLAVNPGNARRLAEALLKAAAACDRIPSAFETEAA